MYHYLFLLCLIFVNADQECDVIDYAQWSPNPRNERPPLSKPVNLVIVQHTATETCSDDESCKVILIAVRQNHIEKLKFTDIGNSFYIGGNGMVYEGAGWNIGAHTRGFNDKSIGVSFIGDFRDTPPPNAALKAVQDFLSCSVKNENLDENYILVGHGQLSPTISPGVKLQEVIETWEHWRDNLL
ncbi:peptidoglycan recognition protein-like [Pieris napi]|uniref:peptidoglycan recognition protein-like n=1 Tax=Pieris napi TaxID=78633 RepID=UPI001FB90127|nr:peptidoglycan recognition protein-like [Pieris napi]